MMRSRSAAVGALLVAACAPDAAAPPTAQVVDSAGVTVVTNSAKQLAIAPAWSLAGSPAMEAGTEASGRTLFQVTGVTPLAGGVAVATRSPAEVVLFDESGAVVRTWGAEGEGPGEFAMPQDVIPMEGDSVAVWDPSRRRLSVFAMDGSFGRDVSLAEASGEASGAFASVLPTRSGALVVFPIAMMSPEPGVHRIESRVTVVDRAGAELGVAGRFPGHQTYRGVSGMNALWFGAWTFPAVSGDDLVVGTAEESEVRVYDLQGGLRRIVRWPDSDRTLTQAMVDDWLEGFVAGVPEPARPQVRAMLSKSPHADRLPAYFGIISDGAGGFWVGDYPGQLALNGAGRPPARHWLVFDAEGVLAAAITTPEGFRPFTVRDGRVYGVHEDDLDRETVRVYEVVKP